MNEGLSVIQTNKLHLTLQICLFMADELIHLGFKVNNQVLSAVKKKIRNISNVTEPNNVSGLKPLLADLTTLIGDKLGDFSIGPQRKGSQHA